MWWTASVSQIRAYGMGTFPKTQEVVKSVCMIYAAFIFVYLIVFNN